MNKIIKAGIIGGTGYTGSELIRILSNHPQVEIAMVTSESEKGNNICDVHPQFMNLTNLQFVSMDRVDSAELDVVFLALPHGVSMNFVKKYHHKEFVIIDLSGDFRLPSEQLYTEWYKMKHCCPEFMDSAVYGMPEINADAVKDATLIANPGCFPTAVILGLIALTTTGQINSEGIIVDAKTGVTGAGAKAKQGTHFPEVTGSLKAYGLKRHRHTPEMETVLSMHGNSNVEILFTPHLMPVDRGILATMYADAASVHSAEKLRETVGEFYKDKPFVRIAASPPSVKQVRGSNYLDLFVDYDERTRKVIIVSAIDNLVKGAAGQAVHNMNIRFNLDETCGLEYLPLHP